MIVNFSPLVRARNAQIFTGEIQRTQMAQEVAIGVELIFDLVWRC